MQMTVIVFKPVGAKKKGGGAEKISSAFVF